MLNSGIDMMLLKEVQILVAVQRDLAVGMAAVSAGLTTARNCPEVSQPLPRPDRAASLLYAVSSLWGG